jgi:hypothetical protein
MHARKPTLFGVAVVVLGVVAGVASAALIQIDRPVVFRSVEANGTLGNPRFTALFTETLNTTNGNFIGSANGTVRNFSNLPQVYIDNVPVPGAVFSLYSVSAGGDASLIAFGRLPAP